MVKTKSENVVNAAEGAAIESALHDYGVRFMKYMRRVARQEVIVDTLKVTITIERAYSSECHSFESEVNPEKKP